MRLPAFLLLTLSASALIACASPTPTATSVPPLTLTDTDSGKSLTLAVGQTLVVTLASNRTTGYSWALAAGQDQSVLKLRDSQYQAPSTLMPGAGGQELWTFTTLAAGSTTLTLNYARPFEPAAPPARTFTLSLTVK